MSLIPLIIEMECQQTRGEPADISHTIVVGIDQIYDIISEIIRFEAYLRLYDVCNPESLMSRKRIKPRTRGKVGSGIPGALTQTSQPSHA